MGSIIFIQLRHSLSLTLSAVLGYGVNSYFRMTECLDDRTRLVPFAFGALFNGFASTDSILRNCASFA